MLSTPPCCKQINRYLSKENFIAIHGIPPWEFVNQILSESNLDFRVESPPLAEDDPYEPKLIKITKDVEMRFSDLSSGEKVLMSFALCLYNTKDSQAEWQHPTGRCHGAYETESQTQFLEIPVE